MTEVRDGVLLTDGRSRIFLHAPERYPDGHGLHHQVDLVGGPFQGSIVAVAYEGPRTFRSFHRELVALYQSLCGEAPSPALMPSLAIAWTPGSASTSVSIKRSS